MDNTKNSILIVDDEPINITRLVHILHNEYTLFSAKSGQEAVTLATENKPDLILLDVFMPDMDGYEVIVLLKSSAATKDIPVIFVTGLEGEENERKGLALGAVDYISRQLNESIIKLRIKNNIQMSHQLRTIENLNKNLEVALAEAESASQAKSNFLAKMSHEIRTPMNAIIGIAQILMGDRDISPQAMEGIQRINNSGDLLLSIINDILDLSKIESGAMEINPQEYKVASLISSTTNLNKMHFSKKDVDFILKVDAEIPTRVVGDAMRIKQILNNLISNSAKYTKEGKVTFGVTYEKEINDSATLVFTINDTGMGMTEKQVNLLFDDYTRFHEGGKRNIEGTGLGMSITKNLIEMMDGKISVQSQPNVGTKITVRIPQKVTQAEPIGETVAENLKKFESTKIKKDMYQSREILTGSVLIVDDTESNLYVAMGLLAPYGLKISTAMGGYEAIDIIKAGITYDIIFMDHMMPDIDGVETVAKLREMGYKNPIVALTANAFVGQADMFIANGFNGFLSKPIDMREMDVMLKKFISA